MVADIGIPMIDILRPLFAIVGGVNFSLLILRLAGMPLVPSAGSISLHIMLSVGVYYFFLRAFNSLNKSDVRAFAALFKL